jgi:hypothetical protein
MEGGGGCEGRGHGGLQPLFRGCCLVTVLCVASLLREGEREQGEEGEGEKKRKGEK